jgi:hypothetical protein
MEYDYFTIVYIDEGEIKEQVCFSERLLDLWLRKFKLQGKQIIEIKEFENKNIKNNRKI